MDLLNIPKDTHYFSGSESKLIFACASGFKEANQELGCGVSSRIFVPAIEKFLIERELLYQSDTIEMRQNFGVFRLAVVCVSLKISASKCHSLWREQSHIYLLAQIKY